MTNFALFAFVWPVIGTLLVIAFGLFLARRTRILYETTQAEAAQRQAEDRTVAANAKHQPEPQRAGA
jgi:hypothetical protein